LPIAAKRLDLPLGLALFRRRGEALGDGLAIHLVGQPRMRAMTRIIGTVTMATRITAATTCTANRPGAKIFQVRNLPQDYGPLMFQIGERLGHGRLLNRAYHIRSVPGLKKRNLPIPHSHVAHPREVSPDSSDRICDKIGKGVNVVEPVGFLPAQFPQNSSEWPNSRSFPANSGHVSPLFIAEILASR